jgi:hypothetical protein
MMVKPGMENAKSYNLNANTFYSERLKKIVIAMSACLCEAPPPEALRRAGASAKAGHTGVTIS